ncbi:MAG: hypothetical protein U1D25_09140 [Hydrogenophaga sp.]|uniref:hypothetical protein n=1 Tax=Hydrogenophaga sp. TaxID=1904254 RepID=UPI002AB83797|nr:hypothetical protein [Hydrogenophaga sp.]MDZ4188254.1 hypothetical protein [Hydrogenophaga sp.]
MPSSHLPLSAQPLRATTLAARWFGLMLCSLALSGCAVIAVADLAASAVVGAAGLAVDAAVGTVKIGGKVIGKTADVVLGSDAAPAD